MKLKRFLIFCILLGGCSSAHQITLDVPIHQVHNENCCSTIKLYVPDSLMHLPSEAVLSGGLCQGHKFDVEIGKGIIDAFRCALGNYFDTTKILPSIQNDTIVSLRMEFFIDVKNLKINVEFSPNAFSVNINASVDFEIRLTGLLPKIEHPTSDMGGMQRVNETFHISTSNSGKADDCHDAVIYLKAAGEKAMKDLCDSIVARLQKYLY